MSSAWDQLEQMLTCPICLDKFKNPRLLPCQHTFCGDACMEGLIDYARRQIKCPECRAEHRIPYQGVGSLPSNVTLIRFLELHSRITGDEPEPVPTFMEKCSVCGEKIEGVSKCAHCEKKVCPECKDAHLDLLKREIGRVTSQIKRCTSKLNEFKDTLQRNEHKLEANYRSTRAEIEQSCRRLIDDLTQRQQQLLIECDAYVEGERETLKKLNESLETELTTIESNLILADEHLTDAKANGASAKHQRSETGETAAQAAASAWTDKELCDAKEIYVRTLEFMRLFEPELGDFTRKMRFVPVNDFESMRRKLAEVGQLKLTESAATLLAASLAESGGAHGTGAGGAGPGLGLMHSASNTSMASGFLSVPSSANALMRSQSDHRLAVQFQQQQQQQQQLQQSQRQQFGKLSTTSDHANDDFRSRYAPPPLTGSSVGANSTSATKRHDDLTRDWPRPGDRDTDDYLATSGLHFRSAFMRKKREEKSTYGGTDDYGGDNSDDERLSVRGHVRFQADTLSGGGYSTGGSANAPTSTASVFECEQAERGPLSGVMRLLDSPYLQQRLHQLDARAKADAKRVASMPQETSSGPTDVASVMAAMMAAARSQQAAAAAAAAGVQLGRQMSEDEIEKQKKANNTTTGATTTSTQSTATQATTNELTTTNESSQQVNSDNSTNQSATRSKRTGIGRLRRQQSSTDTTPESPASPTPTIKTRRAFRSQLSRQDSSLINASPSGTSTTENSNNKSDSNNNNADDDDDDDDDALTPAARQRRRIQQKQQQQQQQESPIVSRAKSTPESTSVASSSHQASGSNVTAAVSKNVSLGSATTSSRATESMSTTSDTDDTDDDDTDDDDDDARLTMSKNVSPVPQSQLSTIGKSTGANLSRVGQTLDDESSDSASSAHDSTNELGTPTNSSYQRSNGRTLADSGSGNKYSASLRDESTRSSPLTSSSASAYRSRRNYGDSNQTSATSETSDNIPTSPRRTSRELLPSAVSLLLDRSAQIRRDSLEARQRTDSPVRVSPLVTSSASPVNRDTRRDDDNSTGITSSPSSNRAQRALAYQRSQSQSQSQNDDHHSSTDTTISNKSTPRRYTDRYRLTSKNSDYRKSDNEREQSSHLTNSPPASSASSSSFQYSSAHRSSIDDSATPRSTPYQSRFLARSRTAAALASRSSTSTASTNTNNNNGSQDSDDTTTESSTRPSYLLSSRDRFLGSTSSPSSSSAAEQRASRDHSSSMSDRKQSTDRLVSSTGNRDRDLTNSSQTSGSSTPTSYQSAAYQSSRNDDMAPFEGMKTRSQYLRNKFQASRRSSASGSTNSNSSLVLRSRSSAAMFGTPSSLHHLSQTNSSFRDSQSDQSVAEDEPSPPVGSRHTSFGSLPESAQVYMGKCYMSYKIGSRGSDPGNFTWPRGVAVTPNDDRIVVADSSNHRVQTFTSSGRFLSEFGTYGSSAAQFDCLAGVAISRNQQYIVSDRYNHRIQIFDQNGRFVRAFGSTGRAEGKFNLPWGVACDSLGLIYVCDKENHRVQVLDINGNYVNQFGTGGSRPGQLQHPHYICAGHGKAIVTDTNNHRVQMFDTLSGRLIGTFGAEGSANGHFKFPRGVAMDDVGNIIVGDSGNNRLQVFTNDGVFVKSLGTWGSADGEFKGIEGVAVNSNYQILVCDRENHRIQIF